MVENAFDFKLKMKSAYIDINHDYPLLGNVSLEELVSFIKKLNNDIVVIPSNDAQPSMKPQLEAPFDIKVEENE